MLIVGSFCKRRRTYTGHMDVVGMGTNGSPWGVRVPVLDDVCAGFVGARSELELGPVALWRRLCGVSRTMYAKPRRDRTCCGIEITWDVPACSAGVGKSVHVGE